MKNKRTKKDIKANEAPTRDTAEHRVHQRKTIVSIEQRLESRRLQNLVANLLLELEGSGLTKPAFASKLGISGSQFRYLRSGVANPSMGMLASFAERLERPLYELLENRPLDHRQNLSSVEMNAVFSATVKTRYAESGMSYGEFADHLGVSVPQLYLILRGVSNPALLMVEQIARRLVVDLWVLLGVEAKSDQSRRKIRRKSAGN